jgi:hypothetical protein
VPASALRAGAAEGELLPPFSYLSCMDAETGSRALHAANDLVEVLRLAQGAIERVAQEVHGAPFEQADRLAHDMQRLRRLAERLQGDIERFVSREESAAGERGHPLRRASDHHSQIS